MGGAALLGPSCLFFAHPNRISSWRNVKLSDMSEISRVTGDDGVKLHHGAIFFSTAGTRFALTHLNPHDARAREAEANFILRWRQTDVFLAI